MKAIVMGERGMLGSDIVSYFRSRGATVLAFSSSQCDVTNRDCLADVLLSHTDSDIVINCAAYTAVDDCEKERERAFLVNGQAPGFLAQVCDRIAVPLVHFSTDYVFDGNKRGYYDESDATAPLSVYGASKLQGEQSVQSMLQSHYIFRVQWLYGVNGNHFLKTISRLAAERSELTIVNDQWGSPTWTYDIARYLYAFLSAKPAYGLYHFSDRKSTRLNSSHSQQSRMPSSA